MNEQSQKARGLVAKLRARALQRYLNSTSDLRAALVNLIARQPVQVIIEPGGAYRVETVWCSHSRELADMIEDCLQYKFDQCFTEFNLVARAVLGRAWHGLGEADIWAADTTQRNEATDAPRANSERLTGNAPFVRYSGPGGEGSQN